MISDDVKQQMREICARYPEPRSGTLLCLHLAQEQEGYITPEGIAAVAEVTGSKRDEIESVVTFYSMYFREPPGRYVVNVCTSISCYLGGCDHLLAHLEERLAVRRGETRADGRYTLRGVECLAACGMAPVLQVNGEFVERVTTESADALVDRLERGETVASAPGAWNVLADGRPQDTPTVSGASVAEDAAGSGRQQGEKAR
ncbi:MAG TPA: NAD(P)H-dependent oxidoreductase subunit E [Ktedonobacterales bacterium]|nr:NAD(P)H-dependent oxidoreductase subunit E [Ktedonobacterales bacterium]